MAKVAHNTHYHNTWIPLSENAQEWLCRRAGTLPMRRENSQEWKKILSSPSADAVGSPSPRLIG